MNNKSIKQVLSILFTFIIIVCERFKKEFQKGYSCQIYGVPYNEIEINN